MSIEKVRTAAEAWVKANPRYEVTVEDDYTLTIVANDSGARIAFALSEDLRKPGASATLIRHAIAKHMMQLKPKA